MSLQWSLPILFLKEHAQRLVSLSMVPTYSLFLLNIQSTRIFYYGCVTVCVHKCDDIFNSLGHSCSDMSLSTTQWASLVFLIWCINITQQLLHLDLCWVVLHIMVRASNVSKQNLVSCSHIYSFSFPPIAHPDILRSFLDVFNLDKRNFLYDFPMTSIQFSTEA